MTDNIHIQQVLHQMRIHAAKASGELAPNTTQASEGGDFSKLLTDAIDKVNDAQQTSAGLKTAYEQGDPSVNLIDVMLASQKAGLSFEATVQVRNKLVSAYQEIMSMPV